MAMRHFVALILVQLPGFAAAPEGDATADVPPAQAEVDGALKANPKDDGYRGIWFTLGQKGDYGDKYSGGLGTYTAKHRPLAIYAPEANKTFFVYGGANEGQRYLLIMISYFDHSTGLVPQPTIVHDKGGVNDPHDNASIALDGQGHVWVFVSGRGQKRPGFKYRSAEPYSIDRFEQVSEEEMTYPQPWWVTEHGFIHMFTKYTKGRELYWNTSPDGYTWSDARKLAGMGGHYQVSAVNGARVATAFNYHPGGNVDRRTNLYYVQSDDMGETWRTISQEVIETPLIDPACPALVRDFEVEKRLVYVKDLNFDAAGRPVILVVTSADHMPGPQGDPRTWMVVHWDGAAWHFHEVTQSTHNYDMGQIWVERGDLWRIIGPTERGPQPLGAGGEMALWESRDLGASWTRTREITRHSRFNHNYARRPLNAQDVFYAFWADGNPDEFSPSKLYFTNRDGSQVWELPYHMGEAFVTPSPMYGRR